MKDTTVWDEISKIKNHRKKAYFQWKNNIENIRRNYGAMTEDEFVEYCSRSWMGGKITAPDEFFKHMERWESTPEYKRLMCLLKEDNFAMDLLDVYEQVKKKAKDECDSQAIKNMISLQKEIKKYRKSIDKYFEKEEKEEQDDGLII